MSLVIPVTPEAAAAIVAQQIIQQINSTHSAVTNMLTNGFKTPPAGPNSKLPNLTAEQLRAAFPADVLAKIEAAAAAIS